MPPKFEDLTGKRFGNWFVQSFDGFNPSAYWICLCDCGTTRSVAAYSLKSGLSASCGCKKIKDLATRKRTHGMSSTAEYKAWESIKGRCLNENDSSFDRYGAKGVTVSEDIKNDFSCFIEAVGMMPEGEWTIDRIDYNKGYEDGNLRWATRSQQARNRGKFRNNTSGVTGVTEREGQFVAFWSELVGGVSRRRTKSFSILKLGYEAARSCAIEYRTSQIKRLNSLGYDYSENHGL